MNKAVLIAEGDAELCGRNGQFLTENGYEVETCTDALECLKKLRQKAPALLILDVALRWGGGDGVLAWIREDRPSDGIRVILTAASEYPHVSAAFIDVSVVDILSKPFMPTSLLESVRTALAKGGRTAPSLESTRHVAGCRATIPPEQVRTRNDSQMK